MDLLGAYFSIPTGYARALGGLRWSPSGDAVDEGESGTFAFSRQIALFLEGFASTHRLISFSHLLHCLHFLGYGSLPRAPEVKYLADTFKQTGRPLRNAGALMGMLCKQIIPVPAGPDPEKACQWLSSSALMASLFARWDFEFTSTVPVLPSLLMPEFEELVLKKLRLLTNAELYHWLRHGRGPATEEGNQLAQSLEINKPRSLTGVLADLARRERLAGAVPYVAQLVSALTLPPRRLVSHQLPIGGYADVTSRGQPEQLLPSQFMLEDLEFVRRFAANELLFFRREPPHSPLREDLVLVLDQGVRTWGDVRLILSAAVFALGKLSIRRKITFLLGSTSNGGRLVDPVKTKEDDLAALLEASDLSANPGLALETVLEETTDHPRDVVVLTHPRSLNEPDVQIAARRIQPNARLFALGVNDKGDAQFSELKHGKPIKLNRFQVELSQQPVPLPYKNAKPAPTYPAFGIWQGDVEPIGFPFRLGLTGRLRSDLFTFNESGDHLLAATQNGMLTLFNIRQGNAELLPRGMVGSQMFTDVQAVLGVVDGFVVCGELGDKLVAVHYDLVTNTCNSHIVLQSSRLKNPAWTYIQRFHCIVARINQSSFGVDLSEAKAQIKKGLSPRTDRSHKAEILALSFSRAVSSLKGLYKNPTGKSGFGLVDLIEKTGRIIGSLWLESKEDSDISAAFGRFDFVPLIDGRPAFRGCKILGARNKGWFLALHVLHRSTNKSRIYLLRGPEGVLIHEFPGCQLADAFDLSEEAQLMARMSQPERLLIHDFQGNQQYWHTLSNKFHSGLNVEVNPKCLRIQAGKYRHVLAWGRGKLRVVYCHENDTREAKSREYLESINALSFESGLNPLPAALPGYLRQRFTRCTRTRLLVAVDPLGHVAFLHPNGKLVCMVFVFRQHLAIWLPNGVQIGSHKLLNGPPTPGALEFIDEALTQAWLNPETVAP
jgi:hypothetical protein